MLLQPRPRVTADGCVEDSLSCVNDVGHRGCSRAGSCGVGLSDDRVHRSNFRSNWPFAGKNLVDIPIARLSNIGQLIAQIVYRIGNKVTLATLCVTLLGDSIQAVFATQKAVHQIVRGAPSIYR
ncbi:hypothetical protein MYBA111488_19930 [Mycobacterium basiliense]